MLDTLSLRCGVALRVWPEVEPASVAQTVAFAVGTAVSFVALVVVNVLGSTGAIGVGTNADLSRKYPTPVTPAGYAFSIWGLIFLLQAVWTVTLCVAAVLAVRAARSGAVAAEPAALSARGAAAALGWWLCAAWWFESLWTFAFNYDVIWLSLSLMYGAHGTLLVAALRAYAAASRAAKDDGAGLLTALVSPAAARAPYGAPPTRVDALKRIGVAAVTVVPTGVNVGWVTVAAVVNTFIVVTRYAGTPGADGAPYVYPAAAAAAAPTVLCAVAFGALTLGTALHAASLLGAVAWGVFAITQHGAAANTATAVNIAAWTATAAALVGAAYALVAPYVAATRNATVATSGAARTAAHRPIATGAGDHH